MNEDEFGAVLLRPLDGEPAGPARIDVAKAMRDGRRMRRRRWWAWTPACAAVTATAVTGAVLATGQGPRPGPDLPPEPPVPAGCTAAVLPMGAHSSAEVSGGDPTGTWLVGRSDPMTPEPAVPHSVLVWRDGKLVADLRPPDAAVRLTDVNASGVAVGASDRGTDYPYVYRDGVLRKLAGGAGRAVAINDAGVIVGMLGPSGEERPVRWASADAQPTSLTPPADVPLDALRIEDLAEDGTIAASILMRGYLWLPEGTGRFLDPPKSDGPARWFQPTAFRYGWLYGTVGTPDGSGLGARLSTWRYELRTGTWQQLAADGMGTQIGGGNFASNDPAVYVGRSVLRLGAHAPSAAAGMDSFLIESVSADSRVVGGTAMSGRADPSKPGAPIMWRCR